MIQEDQAGELGLLQPCLKYYKKRAFVTLPLNVSLNVGS